MSGCSVAFIVPYPIGEAPSQRFRFEQYFTLLQQEKITFQVYPFLSISTWKILYKPGYTFSKITGIVTGFLRRTLLLFHLWKYDYIFIHREATPVGPPIFEWLIAKVFCKKIIFDFDDAIWLPNTSENNKIVAGIKWHSKTAAICKWAYKISCGNSYLCNYARHYNANVVLNPTTIDTQYLHNTINNQEAALPVIGWTGSHSTIDYLNDIIPVIAQLEKEFPFIFLVISNRKPHFNLKSLQFLPWNKTTEIADLSKINIGIMPLKEDAWSEGKCGFKALQYMALGAPAVVSPVGVNKKIVQQGVNGFLATNKQEWMEALSTLLQNNTQRKVMGSAARKTIEQHFSVISNSKNFLELFR